jgi:carboxypeptidase PM20D1
VDSAAYHVIARTAADIFPGYVVTPYLMVAATDSRMYADIADGVYRFQPFASMSEDLGTIHAAGERLSIESLREGTAFFIQLVKNADE